MFSLDMRIFIMLLYFYIPCTTQNAVEVEKVEMTKNVLLLQASNTELNAKVDSLNKIIEANKKTKKELQVRNYLILLDHYLFLLTVVSLSQNLSSKFLLCTGKKSARCSKPAADL
jgi:hypothetical protein